MSLPILLPLALNLLENDPLVSGDFYEGDLLVQVLQCRDEIFQDKALIERATLICQKAARHISCHGYSERFDAVSTQIAMFHGTH